jgi:hypothetical protein
VIEEPPLDLVGPYRSSEGVEQTIALLHWFRRLRIRWEIRDDIHEAFLTLACAIVCWRRLQRSKS